MISSDENPRKTRLKVIHVRILEDGVELQFCRPLPREHPGKVFRVPFTTRFTREAA